MSQSHYLKFIAYMQVICIILVVFGHSFHQFPDGFEGKSLLIYRMMYSFRMPSFIFVSGFLMAYTSMLRTDEKVPSFGKFAVNKLKRLIIPYLTLTIVTFLPRVLLNSFADDPMELSATQLVRTLLMPGDLIIPYFWFIQVSFLLLIFSYAIFSLCRARGYSHMVYIVLMAILFLALPLTELSTIHVFSIHLALNFGIFFLAGIAYSVYMQQVDRFIPWGNIATFIAFAATWAVSFFFTEDTDWSAITKFLGIGMVISFSHILVERRITFLDHLTGCNYIIFLLSWYFNVFSQQVMSKVVTFPWWVYTLLSLLTGIYGPFLFYIYMTRNKEKKIVKCISFLLGQKLKDKPSR